MEDHERNPSTEELEQDEAVEAVELGEDDLEDAAGGDPGYTHPDIPDVPGGKPGP
jgi:hypothetical protein